MLHLNKTLDSFCWRPCNLKIITVTLLAPICPALKPVHLGLRDQILADGATADVQFAVFSSVVALEACVAVAQVAAGLPVWELEDDYKSLIFARSFGALRF